MFKKKISTKKIIVKIAIVFIFICAFTLSLLATIFILENIGHSGTQNNEKLAISTSDIISDYSKIGIIKGLSSDNYLKQAVSNSTIDYKDNSFNYSLVMNTDKSVEFISTNNQLSDDTKIINDQTKLFMEKEGLETDIYNADSEGLSNYTTYSNDKTVCQLLTSSRSVIGTNSPIKYYKLSCIDKSSIGLEYDTIEKLLTIYNQTQKPITFTEVRKITKTDANKSYSIINLINNTSRNRLLFAAIDDNWEYLGDLSVGTTNNKTSKYLFTPELSTKINDPKYGDFISKDIK